MHDHIRQANFTTNLHSLCVRILFNSTALGIDLRKTSKPCNFKMRLGGEICSSAVNIH